MFSTESRRGRRVLARLDRGMDLFDCVRTLCQKHHIRCGELRGMGSLELAELAAFDQNAKKWKPGRVVSGGGLELIHLHGHIAEEGGALSVQVRVALMRDRDAGVEVVGGHLERAVVHSVELIIETFDDVLLRRQIDAATGLSSWQEALAEVDAPGAAVLVSPPLTPVSIAGPGPTPTPGAPPNADRISTASAPTAKGTSTPGAPPAANRISTASAPAANRNSMAGAQANANRTPMASARPTASRDPNPPNSARVPALSTATPTPTWADVAAASQPAPQVRPSPEPELHEEEVLLNAGDVILHPRFQRCVVHRVEGGGEFVQVMLRNGRVVRLSLEVLRLTPQGTENGQRIFSATVL